MLLVIAADDVRHLTAESVGRDAAFGNPIHADSIIATWGTAELDMMRIDTSWHRLRRGGEGASPRWQTESCCACITISHYANRFPRYEHLLMPSGWSLSH
jgi:hypothetical protein